MLQSVCFSQAEVSDSRVYYSLGHRTQADFGEYTGVEGEVLLPRVTGLGELNPKNINPEAAYQYLGVETFGQTIDFGLVKTKKSGTEWKVFAYYIANDERNAKNAYEVINKIFPKSSSRFGKAPFFSVWTEVKGMTFADGKKVKMRLEVTKENQITLTISDGKKTYTVPYYFAKATKTGKGLIFRRESNLIAYGTSAGIEGSMDTKWTKMKCLKGTTSIQWTRSGYFYRDDEKYQDGIPENVFSDLSLEPLYSIVHYGS